MNIIFIILLIMLVLIINFNVEKYSDFQDSITTRVYKNEDKNIIISSNNFVIFKSNNTEDIVKIDVANTVLISEKINSFDNNTFQINSNIIEVNGILNASKTTSNESTKIRQNNISKVVLNNGNVYVGKDLHINNGLNFFPTGMIALWPTDKNPPVGWAKCGAVVNRFDTSKLLGKCVFGYDRNNTDPKYALYATGGELVHTITDAEIPNHVHTLDTTTSENSKHTHIYYGQLGNIMRANHNKSNYQSVLCYDRRGSNILHDTLDTKHFHYTTTNNSSFVLDSQNREFIKRTPRSNMPPYKVLNYIVKIS